MNPNYQKQYTLSKFISVIRDVLKNQGFFDHHLYSTIEYKIENTDTFKIKDNLYLRYNPEPDIWQVGINHDKFFWIGSMFRNEKKLSNLRKNEFTVVDIYQSQGTMDWVVKKYIEILKTLEKELHLPILSDLEIKYISHNDFSENKNRPRGTYWAIVTDYPVDESFYDLKGKDDHHTLKFEIFFVNENEVIEIAACGNLGENLNTSNMIKTEQTFLHKDVLAKKFIGFGIGLERLMHLYTQEISS